MWGIEIYCYVYDIIFYKKLLLSIQFENYNIYPKIRYNNSYNNYKYYKAIYNFIVFL